MGPRECFSANNSSFFRPSCPALVLPPADNDGYQGCSKVGDKSSLVIAASLSVLSLLHIEDLFEFIVVQWVYPFAIHHLVRKVQDSGHTYNCHLHLLLEIMRSAFRAAQCSQSSTCQENGLKQNASAAIAYTKVVNLVEIQCYNFSSPEYTYALQTLGRVYILCLRNFYCFPWEEIY